MSNCQYERCMYMNVLIDLISREVSGAFEKAGFDPAYG